MGTALAPEARNRREELEERIDNAFINARKAQVERDKHFRSAGNDLHAIKHEGLFSDDYDDFDTYVSNVWDLKPERAKALMTAAQIANTLEEFELGVEQLTLASAMALARGDDPVQVWSEVSAASPSPTALEIEQVAKLHLPLLKGESLTKDEERAEIASAEEEIDKAVAMGRAMAVEKKMRVKLKGLKALYEPLFAVVRPKLAAVFKVIGEVLEELGE